MKTLWRPWHCLWIGLAAGCASSTADQTEQRSNRSALEPEWVQEETPTASVAVAAQIQPIPDLNDEDSAGNTVPASVKPIPDDDRR
jgi:hypothetical protein